MRSGEYVDEEVEGFRGRNGEPGSEFTRRMSSDIGVVLVRDIEKARETVFDDDEMEDARGADFVR